MLTYTFFQKHISMEAWCGQCSCLTAPCIVKVPGGIKVIKKKTMKKKENEASRFVCVGHRRSLANSDRGWGVSVKERWI